MVYDDSTQDEGSLEESYWSALLNEGEFAKSAGNGHEDTSPTTNPPLKSISSAVPNSSLETDWGTIYEIRDEDRTIDVEIVGFNRGGLLIEWESLQGFVPASQLVEFPNTSNSDLRWENLAEYVGKNLQLRIIELDKEQNRFILSERAAKVEAGKRDEILTNLSSGDIIEGIVTNLCDFGAFIDLGGIEGLIHISELSWGRVRHPSDILVTNETIRVYVLEVDEEESRVALSLKRLHEDPWKNVQHRYRVGEIVKGRITNVVDFGAFACIEEGLEGLIHYSELAEGHFLHPRNVVAEDDIVEAKILTIDGQARRLGLSLRLND